MLKRILSFLLFFSALTTTKAGNFTQGNIVVTRVGSGSVILSNAAQPVFLDEYTRSGTLVQSIALPVATSGSNHPFSLSGAATSEGTLTLSANGQYLTLAGYDAVPGTLAVIGDSTLNRVAARIGTNGTPNTSTGILAGAAYYKDNVRAAVSSDGTKFWLAGNGVNDLGGTYYIPFGSFTNSPVKVSSPPNNTRTVNIFNNQLYLSSQTNTFNGVSIVGNGLPSNSGNTTTLLPGFTAPSSFSVYSFWLFDMDQNVSGMDVLYFCDDRDIAPNGGLYKYSLVNGTWVSNGNVPVPNNLKGITAERTCFTQIFCSSGTRIFSLRDDNGYNESITGSLTQIAMAATNTKFRGIAFAPGTQTLTPLQANTSATNVSCFNAGNGSITLSVSGGVAPFTYEWNNGSASQNRNNLSPGTYTVTVTDVNSCTAIASATISQPAQLSVSASKTDVSCNGGNNGTVTLTVNGGTPAYSFIWNGGATAQNRSNLSAGTHNVTVTDDNGCTATTSVTITQPAALTATTSKTNVSCNGGSNGTITLSPSGGITPYTFNWSNNATVQNPSGLSAGTYQVTITDVRNCTVTASATISQPAALNVASAVTNVQCNGGNSGAVDLTVSGGSSPYTYNWSNGASTQDISGLSAGLFNVTVQDANGCTVAANATVSQPAALSSGVVKTNVRCNGESNGAVNLSVSGGTAPYGFAWSNNATSEDISALAAGIYNVTISDANGCSATNGTTITQPNLLVASVSKTNVVCNGAASGAIDLSVTGGTPAYSFQWSNSATSQDVNNLTAGVYSVTITDNNSCSATSGATVTEPSQIASAISKTDVSCHGNSDGILNLSVSGGVNPYSYSWSNNAVTQNINALVAASYTVTITDANNCSATNAATILQPAMLTVSTVKTDVLCNGNNTGTVELTVAGGTSPYSYNWSNNATTQNIGSLAAGAYAVTVTDANNCTTTAGATISEPGAISINQTVTNASCNGGTDGTIDISVSGGVSAYLFMWSNGANTEDLANVSAGIYHVTVADNNGCMKSASVPVGEASALAITLVSKTDLTCNAGDNGSINIAATGGALPYIFSWSNAAVTEDLSGLAAGNYILTVSDANNCSKVESYTISPAPVLTANVVRRNVGCFGGNDGEANLTVSGGTTPYTFIWSTASTNEDVIGLAAGIYFVTAADVNGCSVSAGTIISEPTAITTALTTTPVSCNAGNDGAVDLSVSGGTPPFTYAWSNAGLTQDIGNISAGNFSVTITDVKGCVATTTTAVSEPDALVAAISETDVSCNNGSDASIQLEVSGGITPYSFDWSNGFTQEDISGLQAGIFSVTIEDANACTITSGATIIEPDQLTIASSYGDVSCFESNDGFISLTASGGTPSYAYNWSTTETTQGINGLQAGNYSVTVTDANGCSANEGFTISQPDILSIAANVTNLPCSGGNTGAIDLTVSGGVANYFYSWNNGDTTEDLSSLTANTYSVTVTDGNGCAQSLTADVTQAGTLQVVSTAIDVSCNGLNDGAILLSVSGGTPDYHYAWSNGDSAQHLSNLTPGDFTVTISDANGCSLSETMSILQPDQLVVSAATENITCFGAGDGSISLSVSGGKFPYVFNWENGMTTDGIINLTAGSYAVTITDSSLCALTTSAVITEPDSISLLASLEHVSLFGASDGAITINIGGGVPDYSFTWSNGANAQNISNLSAGDYCLTVSDENSCTVNKCFTVNQPPSSVENINGIENCTVFFLNERLIIQAQLAEASGCQLLVYDLTGRLLAKNQFRDTRSFRTEVPFDTFANGCYLIRLCTEKGAADRKVVFTRQ